jgi:Domain of unknown function (DUF4352)
MRIRCAVFVAGAILLAGCGSKTKTVVQTVTEPSTVSSAEATTETKTQPTPSARGCDSVVESSTKGVGECESTTGETAKYAGVGHHLILSGLTMRYISVTTAPSVSTEGDTAKAHGTFVIVTAELTNSEHSAQNWSSSQSSLLINGDTYEEAFNAENGKDQHSLLWVTNSFHKLQPGETKTGDLVYDIPSSALRAFGHEGGAVTLKDFGEEESKESYGGLLLIPKA